MKYLVLASLYDDLNQGWVWMTNSGLESRSIVKITNKKNNEKVFCECLNIDRNYMTLYNNPPRKIIEKGIATITINEWYRKKLGGIETKIIHELEIKAANGWCGKIRANLQHPQNVVRMATLLALISVVLGVLSAALGVISICLSI